MAKAFTIQWAPVARGDLDDILNYIVERDCVDAAMKVYERIVSEVETLMLHPERCRIPPELDRIGVTEYREQVLAPYSVFFRLREHSVNIVAVFDRRRDLEELLLQRVLRSQ